MMRPDALMPDDLIRLRNWEELTATEKEQLKEVAATEEAFRLLKLMLATAPLNDEVPLLNPALRGRLKTHFQAARQTTPKTISWRRYAAAAAVFAVIAGTVWLLLVKQKKENAVARTTPQTEQINYDTTSAHVTRPVTEVKITPKEAPVAIPVSTRKKAALPQKRENKKSKMLPPVPVEAPNTSLAINARLKDNSELLQLVTEVY
jgi:anti-sigma factor RsiW